MTNWQTVGHLHIKRVLDAQLLSGRLANAYLFQGPAGLGKRTLAGEFAEKLSPLVSNRIHFDLAANGAVDQIRELLRFTSLTADAGQYKTIVIDNFEEASPAVSNALLKTLEEPPRQTVFCLISGGGAVLPTIQSRCVTLRFAKLSDEEMQSFAKERRLSVNPAGLAFAAGVPQRLQAYASAEDSAIASSALIHKLDEVCRQSPARRLLFLSELAEQEPAELKHLLLSWIAVLRYRLRDAVELSGAIHVAQETLKRLSMNANKKMSLEYLLLNTKL